jgi:hypothetical protein
MVLSLFVLGIGIGEVVFVRKNKVVTSCASFSEFSRLRGWFLMRLAVKLFIIFIVGLSVFLILKWLLDSWVSGLSHPSGFGGLVFVGSFFFVFEL